MPRLDCPSVSAETLKTHITILKQAPNTRRIASKLAPKSGPNTPATAAGSEPWTSCYGPSSLRVEVLGLVWLIHRLTMQASILFRKSIKCVWYGLGLRVFEAYTRSRKTFATVSACFGYKALDFRRGSYGFGGSCRRTTVFNNRAPW